MIKSIFLIVAFSLSTIFLPIAKAQDTFPSPVGFVNDFANILTDTTSLEYELSEYEKNTTIEIALVTLQELPEDQTLFTYGVELFQYWQIGKKGEDNGILILIVPNGTIGKRLRIELGYGIQGYITGAEAGRILDQALPYYEQGDYQSAAEATIAGLKEQLVNYQPGQAIRQSQANIETTFTATFMLFFALMILIPIAYSIFGNKCPNCGARGQLKCEYDGSAYYKCTCKKCGHSFRKKRSNFMFVPIAGGFSGGGGGFGGFGGGGSGGGGAGR